MAFVVPGLVKVDKGTCSLGDVPEFHQFDAAFLVVVELLLFGFYH